MSMTRIVEMKDGTFAIQASFGFGIFGTQHWITYPGRFSTQEDAQSVADTAIVSKVATKAKKPTARLENWSVVYDGLRGEIYDDSQKRWPNGEVIRTSALVHLDTRKKYCETRNTIYRLGKSA